MLLTHTRRLVRWMIVAFPLSAGAAWAQCPMCKTAILASEEGQRMSQGLNAGILYMLAAPYLIVAALAVFAYRAYRRVQRIDGGR